MSNSTEYSNAEHSLDELHYQWVGLQALTLNLGLAIPPFSINSYALLLIHQGHGVIWLNNQRMSIRESHCMLLLPGTRVAFEQKQGELLNIYMMEFNITLIEGSERIAGWENKGLNALTNRLVSVQPLSYFIQLFITLDECKQDSTPLNKFRRNITMQQLLYSFASNASTKEPTSSREAVEQSIMYLQQNYQSNLKLADLAAVACVGVRQYSHIFKQITGSTPMDYLQSIRITNAKKLLHSSSLDMQSVAHQVGYKDEFYFSRKFKQQEGISPTAYLRNRQPRVIGLLYTSHLLALGIIPVGAPDYHLYQNKYVEPYLNKMQSFPWMPCDMDVIKGMEPDIILGYEHMTPGEYEQLSNITEVVRIPWQSYDVYEQLENISGIVDKRKQRQDWMEKHDEKVYKIREGLNQRFGRSDTYAAILLEDEGFRLAGDRNMGHVLYRTLQLKPHPLVKQFIDAYNGNNVFSETFPLYELVRFDASHLIIMLDCHSTHAEERFSQFRQTEQWHCLTAARHGHVHYVSYNRWWMYTPLAMDGQLDDIGSWLSV